RYFGRLQLSLILFTICMSALMAVNYYINSGIQGPTLMLYLLLLVFTLTVMPTQQFLFWMLVNVGIVGALLVFEYYRGHAIKFTYAGRRDFFLDTATTYLCVVACVGAVIFYLIYSYGQEKNKA